MRGFNTLNMIVSATPVKKRLNGDLGLNREQDTELWAPKPSSVEDALIPRLLVQEETKGHHQFLKGHSIHSLLLAH